MARARTKILVAGCATAIVAAAVIVVAGQFLVFWLAAESGGLTEFEHTDGALVITGHLNNNTLEDLQETIAAHPDVHTLILLDVPGSVGDESVIDLFYWVNDRGLATHIPADGHVASGGTDLFLAGAERTIEPGARLGVHSWQQISGRTEGDDREAPEHQTYLDLYQHVGIPEDFYWFTLQAAPPDDMYYLTSHEIDTFNLLTGDPDE